MGWKDRVPYVLSSMNRLADVLLITSQGVLQGDFSGALGLGEVMVIGGCMSFDSPDGRHA